MKLFISIGCEQGERLSIMDAAGVITHCLEHEAANCVIDVDPDDAGVIVGSKQFLAELGRERAACDAERQALTDMRDQLVKDQEAFAASKTAIPEPSPKAAVSAGAADPDGKAPAAATT